MIVLALFAMAGGSTLKAQAGAQHFTQVAEAPVNWTLVSDQNNIKVYMTEITSGGQKYLHLKFGNTSGKDVTIGWELKDKSGKVITANANLTIAAGTSLSGFDDATVNGGNMNILLSTAQTMSDFTISLNRK